MIKHHNRIYLPHVDLGDRADDLYRRARNGDIAARNEIVEANLALAGWYARRYGDSFRHLTKEDVVSLASEGIMRAAERFDPAKGTQFSTYASIWMRQYVSRGNAAAGAWFKEPLSYIEGRQKYLEMLSPRAAEILTRHCERERVSLAGHPVADARSTPAGEVDDEDEAEVIPWGVVSERDAEIVRRRFGFDGPEETLDAIGRDYGITREAVRQIVDKALRKLRLACIAGGAA